MSTKKLGFGLMRLPLLNENDEASVDINKTKEMVDLIFRERIYIF